MVKKKPKKVATKKKAPKRKRPSKAQTPTKTRPLTPMQARFVDEYLVSLNATEAATLAGYSEDTADTQGCQLRKNPKVASAIAEAQSARSERTRITADNVLREWALLGFSSGDLYKIDIDGNVAPKDGISSAVMRAVKSIHRKVTTTRDGDKIIDTKFELWSKEAGLRALSDHLGICSKKSEVKVKGSLFDLISGIEDDEAKESEEE